jgi:hypothetical protein
MVTGVEGPARERQGLRADFEELCHDYEIPAVTPSHAAKIVLERHLRG